MRGTHTYKKGTEVQISRFIVTKVQVGPSYHGGMEQSYKKATRIIKVSYKPKEAIRPNNKLTVQTST